MHLLEDRCCEIVSRVFPPKKVKLSFCNKNSYRINIISTYTQPVLCANKITSDGWVVSLTVVKAVYAGYFWPISFCRTIINCRYFRILSFTSLKGNWTCLMCLYTQVSAFTYLDIIASFPTTVTKFLAFKWTLTPVEYLSIRCISFVQ